MEERHFKKILRYLVYIASFLFFTSLAYVLYLKWLPPPLTPLMVIRCVEEIQKGKDCYIKKDWVPLEDVSMNLQMAVISGEDPNFLRHSGFDFEAIVHAMKLNEKRKRKLGASTISQQTAKNVFLYPSRTYFRKALEAYFTVMIELFWGKKRILEIYLNIVELGKGVYGAEMAAQKYFHTNAKFLNRSQAAILTAMLPSPRKSNPLNPSDYLLRRQNFVDRNMNMLGKSYFQPIVEVKKKDDKSSSIKKTKKKK